MLRIARASRMSACLHAACMCSVECGCMYRLRAGTIEHGGAAHSSISSFALAVLKDRNPKRRACDGWREVSMGGVRLLVMRRNAMRIIAQEAAGNPTGLARKPQ